MLPVTGLHHILLKKGSRSVEDFQTKLTDSVPEAGHTYLSTIYYTDKHTHTHRYQPVSVHVQLVPQQDDGSLRPEGLVVQGDGLQVRLAAFKALHVVDAVDHQEGVGPRQVALTVHRTLLHTHKTQESPTAQFYCYGKNQLSLYPMVSN